MKSLSERLAEIVALLTQKTRFYGFFPYSVTDEVVGKPSLKALGVVDGLPSEVFPDQLHINKAHGLPGATSKLQAGHVVLLGFVGGDPGAPFVAFYPPGQPLPVKIQLNATTEIRLGGGECFPLSVAPATDAHFSSLWTKVNALCTLAGVPPIPGPFSSVATTLVVGE